MDDKTLQQILSDIVRGMILLRRMIEIPRNEAIRKTTDDLLMSLQERIRQLEVKQGLVSRSNRK